MEAVALRNKLETDLFPESVTEELRRIAALLEYETYILLIYITDESYVAELSLPDAVESGQIVSWKERIFIPDTDDPFGGRKFVPSSDSGDEIDIPVRRKA